MEAHELFEQEMDDCAEHLNYKNKPLGQDLLMASCCFSMFFLAPFFFFFEKS